MELIDEYLRGLEPYACSLNDFEIISKIAEGGFGQVFLATHKRTGIKCAVKKLLVDSLDDENAILFIREIRILAECHSQFLLSLTGFSYVDSFLIVTDYIECGSLYEALNNKKNSPRLTNTEKTVIAAGIAHGMAYLHKKKIMHRDLKSLNILLDSNHFPKICDFGIARYKQTKNEAVTQQVGTTHWMAPEQIQTSNYSNKVDVYAFGILLWEMLCEQIPYRGMNQATIILKVTTEGLRPKIPKSCPSHLARLMKMCWDADPNKRPSFKRIYNAFVNHDVDFENTDRDYVDRFTQFVGYTDSQSDSLFAPLSTRIVSKRPEQFDFQSLRPNDSQESLMDDGKEEEEEAFENQDEIELFKQRVYTAARALSKSSSNEFFASVKIHFENPNDKEKRAVLLPVLADLVDKKLDWAKSMASSGIYEVIDADSDDQAPLLAKLVSALISVAPRAFSPRLAMSIMSRAEEHVNEALHVLSKFALVAQMVPKAFQCIRPFLVAATTFFRRGRTNDFLSIINILMQFGDSMANEISPMIAEFVRFVLSNNVESETAAALHFATLVGAQLPPLPAEVLSRNTEKHLRAVSRYLLVARPVASEDLVSRLIKSKDPEALCAVAQIASTPEGAPAVLLCAEWTRLPPLDALHVLAAVLVHPPTAEAVRDFPGVVEVLSAAVPAMSDEDITWLPGFVSALAPTEEFITRASEAGVWAAFFGRALNSGQSELIRAGLRMAVVVSAASFTPELIAVSKVACALAGKQTVAAGDALAAAVAIAVFAPCAAELRRADVIGRCRAGSLDETGERYVCALEQIM